MSLHVRCLLGMAVMVLGVAGSTGGSAALAASDVTVTARARWGDVPPGSWTPYLVTVRNEGGVDVEGEVVLAAQPEPGALPPAAPVAAGRRFRAPRGLETPQWPTYRSPVSVPGGSEKSLTAFGAVRGEADPLLLVPPTRQRPQLPVVRGIGGGAVVFGGERQGVQLEAQPWELRTVQTVSVGEGGADLEVKLRSSATSAISPGRVLGTVTNRGRSSIRQLRAHTQEGQAHLVEVLDPGQSKEVNAPILPFNRLEGDQPPEELVMATAASRAVTGPDQLPVVGLTELPTEPSAKEARRRVGVIVIAVPIEAADFIPPRSGGVRLISTSPSTATDSVSTADLRAPRGAGPLSIAYPVNLHLGDPAALKDAYEVYNWTKGRWRFMPPTPGQAGAVTPLEQDEVNDGLVRMRARTERPISIVNAQLVVTRSLPGPG